MGLTKGYFTIFNNAYVGYSDEKESWNDCDTPCFTKRIADKVIDDLFMDDEFFTSYYDKLTDTYIVKDLTLDDEDGNITEYKGYDVLINGRPIHVYDIGASSSCWTKYCINQLKKEWWFEGKIYK